jgi:two-component system, cell cycle sensor histidine kinase and response regulator CckA
MAGANSWASYGIWGLPKNKRRQNDAPRHGGRGMAGAVEKKVNPTVVHLQNDVRRLTAQIQEQKDLEARLNETLHSLRVHQEELRAQNEDLIAAQQEISCSQRKYRDLFDFAPVGYFLLDTNGAILEVNLTGAEMIGRHRDAIGNKPFFLFVSSEFRRSFDNHLRKLWAGSPASTEIVLTRKDTGGLPVELSSVPVADDQGRITHCRIAAIDISKRWQAEEKFKESEHRLDAIIKNIPDIVYRLDQNGMINFISESIRRYGYAPDDLSGKPLLSLIHPQDQSKARHRVNERRTGPRSTHNLELRLKVKDGTSLPRGDRDGEEHFFLVNAEGLYSDLQHLPDQFIGTQGIAHDITQRKQIELDRLHLEAELQKARKMEAIGTLAGGIAHDFNNLLMGIQGSASLMVLDTPDVDAKNRQRLENIEQCVKRGSELTRQLLGFAKGGKYNVKPVDISAIVKDTAELFGRTHKNINIHREFTPDLWGVSADRGQLEQVLLNILINAGQAMPFGGRILLSTENLKADAYQIKTLGLRHPRCVRILVEDTGVGMDQKIQSRIFEPFFTTKEVGQGTGLGLASAYGIIKNHGGMIDVQSVPGQGSRFYIYLPASSESVMPEREPANGIILGSGTILLVDDEKIVLDVSSRLLEHLGYEVIVAENGSMAEKIYRLRHKEIDLVILDMVMPMMSGFETYNRLKKINPHIRVLLSSGYSKEGQASEIIAQDRQDFVQKPFNLAKLSQKIARILAKT